MICYSSHQLNLPQFLKYDNAIDLLWSLFLMTKSIEVMRERGDQTFIDLLNNIHVGHCSNDNRIQLQQRKISINDSPPDATLITLICAEKMIKTHKMIITNLD